MFKRGKAEVEVDISKFIKQPGQFFLRFDNLGKAGMTLEDIQVFYDGHWVHEEVLSAVREGEVYLLNRHAQIVDESKIVLKVKLQTQKSSDAKMVISIKRAL